MMPLRTALQYSAWIGSIGGKVMIVAATDAIVSAVQKAWASFGLRARPTGHRNTSPMA